MPAAEALISDGWIVVTLKTIGNELLLVLILLMAIGNVLLLVLNDDECLAASGSLSQSRGSIVFLAAFSFTLHSGNLVHLLHRLCSHFVQTPSRPKLD